MAKANKGLTSRTHRELLQINNKKVQILVEEKKIYRIPTKFYKDIGKEEYELSPLKRKRVLVGF